MNKDEMIKSDRIKLMDLLYKLKNGEFCTPNCYGCCGDNELSFAYCPDVLKNFEKEIATLGYRKIAEDEIVIKQTDYVELNKDFYDWKKEYDHNCLLRLEVFELEKQLKQAKQEIVKKILQELSDEGYKIYEQQGYTFDIGNFYWLITYAKRKYEINLE